MVLLALLLVLIAPASAATVSAHPSCDRSRCSTYAHFTAEPGETNALTVTHDEAAVTFLDAVPIRPGKGCTAIAYGARCATGPEAPLSGMTVKLSDRDDVATFDVPGWIDGGAGNDRITGSGWVARASIG